MGDRNMSELGLMEEVEQLHGKIPIEVMYLPRPQSNYAGCFPLHFEKHLPRLLEADSNNIIHLFSGHSKYGLTVDSNKNTPAACHCNAEHLTFPSNSFYAGLADPPYTREFAKNLYDCEYPKWSAWTNELVRVVKKGGLIGIMQNYVVPQLKGCEYVKIVIILLRIKQYPKIFTIQRKTVEKEGIS